MNYSAWKIGFFVAALTGFLTGLGALEISDHIELKKLILFVLVCTAKDLLLYLKEHPLERSIQLPLALLLLCTLPFLGTGCAMQAATQFNAETQDKTHYVGIAFFNKSALEGLSVGKKSKTASTVFSLEKGNTETQGDAIKALAEAVGTAAGFAAKTAVKP